jgi:NADPH:quinone reductase-like Zn-dependent oxidoreductase
MPKVYGFAEYGGPEQQDFWDQPKPAPGPSELLIAVKAAGVNPVDAKIRSGAYHQYMPVDRPAVMGREASGVVEEVGKDVEGFSVGDEVLGTTAPGSGGFAEYTLLTADTATKKPVHVSFADAAGLAIAGVTAYAAVRQLALNEGQTLLIVGIGGGVGVAAAQIARDQGLNVIGTGSEGKRDLAESLDATLFDYTKGDVAGQVRSIMPAGVDGILDLIGGDALREVAGLVDDKSKLITAADPQTAAELGGDAVTRERAGVLAEVTQLVADGKLNPHAVDVLPFDKAAEAVAGVESGHSRGKVVLEIA